MWNAHKYNYNVWTQVDLIICNNSAKFEEYQFLVSFLLYEILGSHFDLWKETFNQA